MKYSDERREAILKKLLPPHNRTVAEVAQEEGISAATLYNWRPLALGADRWCTAPPSIWAGTATSPPVPPWGRPNGSLRCGGGDKIWEPCLLPWWRRCYRAACRCACSATTPPPRPSPRRYGIIPPSSKTLSRSGLTPRSCPGKGPDAWLRRHAHPGDCRRARCRRRRRRPAGTLRPGPQPCTTSHADLAAEERQRRGITDSMLRLSVGLEDVEDLLDDLHQALAPLITGRC